MNDSEPRRYASLSWCVADIPETDPSMTDEQKEDWLASNESKLRDLLSTYGNEAIRAQLAYEGYNTTEEGEEEEES